MRTRLFCCSTIHSKGRIKNRNATTKNIREAEKEAWTHISGRNYFLHSKNHLLCSNGNGPVKHMCREKGHTEDASEQCR